MGSFSLLILAQGGLTLFYKKHVIDAQTGIGVQKFSIRSSLDENSELGIYATPLIDSTTIYAVNGSLVALDMQSGNIAYKLLQRLGGARVVGPVILGLNAPAYVMQRHAGVDEIFNMTTVAVAQAALGEKVIPRTESKKLRIANL